MLEGKLVNLRVIEKEDLPTLSEWSNNMAVGGEYVPMSQDNKTELEKDWLETPPEKKWFWVERKDGGKVGVVGYFNPVSFGCPEIGYATLPNERGKGYCTEAVRIIVDFIFLSKDVTRIQATTELRNIGSQRILEKSGFAREGVLRNVRFNRGAWRDWCLYSMLRDEWKEPGILTAPNSQKQILS